MQRQSALFLSSQWVLSHDGVPRKSVHMYNICSYSIPSFPLTPPMSMVSSNHGHERGNFESMCFCYLNYAYLHKDAIRLPLPHTPVGNNGSGFAYSLAVDASALHQAVQRELLLANIYFSTFAKLTTHPSGEMDRLATKDLQC